MTHLMVPPQPAVRLFFAAFLMLFLELVLIRYLAGNVWNMGYFPNLVLMGVFIGMGLAFLLLETKSVVQFSLLFGTTWLNNSLVFLAVLMFVLLANHLASRFQWLWKLHAVCVLLSGLC